MNTALADPTLNLYTPQAQSAEQLLAEFIDRKGLLERILDILRHNTPDRPQQHLILLGPRGMGKTTLLCAIRHSVDRDPDLSAAWLPLQFAEEQYNIGDLADFWLECIRHLERRPESADRLLDENPPDLAERARERFYELLAGTGKRALLLVDNLNEIFAAIDDGRALHQLRALWMTDPRMTVIGAAPSYFEAITAVDQAFHDFFRAFSLERLNQQELETCLRRYAEILGDDTVPKVIEQSPERVAALRILTGGNPRLVKLGYRVLRDGLDGDLRGDLERLLDEATPFFKHRIDSLAKEARRAFDAIARRWDPVTVDDIRKELRKPSNYVSAQIRRLIDEGFVEDVSGDKKKLYQVSERFYNVYYLWRLSREGRKRLRWLVGFMRVFYGRKDYQEWARRLEGELAGGVSEPIRAEKLAHLHALCAAADYGDGRDEVFEALVRDAIAHDDRRALDEEAAAGDPVEIHGWRYLLAELPWLLDGETRQGLGFRPSDSSWCRRLARRLDEQGQMEHAERRLAELGAWRMDTPRHAYAAGVLSWLFERHAQAEAAFRQALALDPQYAYAWNGLGAALNGQHRYPEAEAACRKALEFDPQFTGAWNSLGAALNGQHRYPEAEAAYRQPLELDPQDAVAWNNLGNALCGQRRYPEAEAAYRQALELDPQDTYAWNNLGAALHGQRRYPEAEAAFRQALALDPQEAAAWNGLGAALNGQHRYPEAEAEAAFRQALEFDPQFAGAWNSLGIALSDQGRYPEAEAAYRQAVEFAPQDVAPWHNLGNALYYQGRYPEAEAAYRKALALDPQDAARTYSLGNALSCQDRYPEAETAYRQALALDSEYAYAWSNLGAALHGQGRYPEAETAYRQALALDPESVFGWSNLGIALNGQRRYPEAEAAYRKALELDPQDTVAWNNLGNALCGQRRYPEAEAAYRKALALYPEYALARISLGGTYLVGLGRIEAGIAELLSGLALEPENPYGRWVLGQHWQPALPPAAAQIAANEPGADNLRAVLTDVLLERAAAGGRTAVRDALVALDETGQAIFEPLLLALRALDDRSILYRIAREKRDLVVDVMKRIGGD